MEAKAIAKYVRMSPIKLKPVTDLVRGKDLQEALNILKFTPGKGAEIVEKVVKSAAANAEENHKMNPDRKVWVRIQKGKGEVIIEIEDNGKGIASKDLPNVFERFYRTDASRNSSKGGSGIGLSIVKKIIEEHGGKIWATSREHTGTTMYFVLRKYQEVPVNE